MKFTYIIVMTVGMYCIQMV